MIKSQLIDKLHAKTAKIGVIGLGYVGLPFCIAAANHGLDVPSFDIDQAKCNGISSSKSYLKHISEADLSGAVQTGRFKATNDFTRLGESDTLVICVPTPFDSTPTSKVVGTDNPDAREVAEAFYGIFVNQVVTVSSSRAAEAVKLTGNIFRAVNITLVNELKVIYEAMGVDI